MADLLKENLIWNSIGDEMATENKRKEKQDSDFGNGECLENKVLYVGYCYHHFRENSKHYKADHFWYQRPLLIKGEARIINLQSRCHTASLNAFVIICYSSLINHQY